MKQQFGTTQSQKLLKLLEEHGHEAVYVGGAVRDFLLGKTADDYDIATSATPNEVKEIFPNTVDIGIEHGTILVLLEGAQFEVTTFRGPNAELGLNTLEEDLRHRDFTMNALAMTKDGELVDFVNGAADLKMGVLRAVDEPIDRVTEDPLRIIRAIRFSAALNLEIEPKTLKAMVLKAPTLENVAVERVKKEFDKLFVTEFLLEAFPYAEAIKLVDIFPFPRSNPSLLTACLPFKTVYEGWAYIMLAGKYGAHEIAKVYKLSNDEKQYLTQVEGAVNIRLKSDFTIDALYHYTSSSLFMAEKFLAAMQKQINYRTQEDFEALRQQLPIHSKKDLVVDGQLLMKWVNEPQGRWIGEWMSKIEYAVLHRQCENDETAIREWFIHDFKK